MIHEIDISVYPKARNIDKARKAIARFDESLGRPVAVKQIYRNEQDPSTYRVNGTIQIISDDPAGSLYEALMIFNNVAHGWWIFPYERTDGCWQFVGRCNEEQIKVQGIKYLAFVISSGQVPETVVFYIEEST